MRIFSNIFLTIFILHLFGIQKSASGSIGDKNEVNIDTNLVDDYDNNEEEFNEMDQSVGRNQRTKGIRNFVGTNLFGDCDGTRKKCFSSEDVALLGARRDFENLIPKLMHETLFDEDLALVLLEYFNEARHVISSKTVGQSRKMAEKAFFDTLGGYLQYYVFPVAKYSFYVGILKLQTVDTIMQLYDESKHFLNTNGNGWRYPIEDFSDFEILIEPLKIIVQSKSKEDTSCVELMMRENCEENMIISLPRIDNQETDCLGNIWLPFKRKQDFNMKSYQSAFILLKYFKLTTRCYYFQGIPQDNFNKKFRNWILENIEIHLKDVTFYPGLGAVLRILETLRKKNCDYVVLDKRQKTDEYKTLEHNVKHPDTKPSSKDWFKDLFGEDDQHKDKPIQLSIIETPTTNKNKDEEARRRIYMYVAIVVAFLLFAFVLAVVYIITCNKPPPKPPVRHYKKDKRVRIHTYNRDDEVFLGPDSSSIASSSPSFRPSWKSSKKEKEDSPPSPQKSKSCFALCTRKRSSEEDDQFRKYSKSDDCRRVKADRHHYRCEYNGKQHR